MSSGSAFFVRWRVRLGYPLAVAVLWLARPTPRSIAAGTVVGLIGLWLRAHAAGYLQKHEILTVTGPYARTRNPLYLGSAILAVGVAVATHSWMSSVFLGVYFTVFYPIVMRREEAELREHYGARFDEYARVVPLFVPRVTAAKLPGSSTGAFSFAQYKKNREYQAAIGFLFLLALLLLMWRLRLP
ncbi:MAG: methyltransferase family protein [Candidatus Acidiferrales bacterium]